MKVVYKDVPGYKDVKILSIRNGSVMVDYDVIIEIEFKSDINVTQQYKDVLKDVETGMSSIVCKSSEDVKISNCISDEFQITETNDLKSEKELCLTNISAGFQDFYEPIVGETGLVCVSQCDAVSTKYTNCQDGICQIMNNTGPHCLDPFASDEEKDWYDDKEEDWNAGINNLVEYVNNVDQDFSKDSFSSREKFKPNLEAIDTTHEVKIQRPQVSHSLSDLQDSMGMESPIASYLQHSLVMDHITCQ
ncbi:unnamed protein product [Ranitomeya imitator]|uniref:Uncharacterized protein n=1 Tax=Ranitomeya imitator TaxID=111125 RepID=A0ABN9MG99_9NEOB|nr:unnamed protein product [Ranitomeya imitator]